MTQQIAKVNKITIKRLWKSAGYTETDLSSQSHGSSIYIGKIFGYIESSLSRETQYGPYKLFKGQFGAIAQPKDGAIIRLSAPSLILPKTQEEELSQLLADRDGNDMQVKLQFDVHCAHDADIKTKYVWVLDQMGVDPTDSLTQVVERKLFSEFVPSAIPKIACDDNSVKP